MVSIVLRVLSLIAGFGLAIYSGIQGDWWLVGISLLLALYVPARFLFGFFESAKMPEMMVLAVLIGGMGFVHVLKSERFFQLDLKRAHIEAFQSFLALDQTCKPMPKGARELADVGWKACAMQDNLDAESGLVAFTKAQYLTPEMSLVDGVISASEGKNSDRCAEAFRQAVKLCPDSFIQVSVESRLALLRD